MAPGIHIHSHLVVPDDYYPGFQRIFFSYRYWSCVNAKKKAANQVSVDKKKYPLQPRVDDYNLTQTIKIPPKVIIWTSKVLLNYKIYSKILVWFYHVHYACVLIISYPLKSLWIMEYNKHLCLQWNHTFGDIFDGTVFSIKWSIFMLLTIDIFHFVKNCIHRLIVILSKKFFVEFKTCSACLETREVDLWQI